MNKEEKRREERRREEKRRKINGRVQKRGEQRRQ